MTFAGELEAATRPFPIESNPFVVAVRNGTCSRDDVRSFAQRLAAAAEVFNNSLFAILSVCDEPAVRQSVLANALEEEGVTSYAGGANATFDAARRHPAMASRFARASGVTDADISALGGTITPWFRQSLQAGNWIGPFAFIVAIEANIPLTFRLIIRPLREHYGFTNDEMEFLIEHVTVDDRHAADGAEAIAAIATTEERRRQALQGARRGAVMWWLLLAKDVAFGRALQAVTLE